MNFPENFLMGKSGTLKLTDFGFARELEPDERLYSQFGTPEYVAPEVRTEKSFHLGFLCWRHPAERRGVRCSEKSLFVVVMQLQQLRL